MRQPDLQAIPETVVWKIRPCDAAGFASLSGIFNWDYKDGSYNARAERLTLISFSCATSDEYCFCTSVGGGPGSTTGSDIQLTLLPDGGALVEVLTPKGERLAAEASSLFASADGISKESIWPASKSVSMRDSSARNWISVRQPGLETAVRALSRLRGLRVRLSDLRLFRHSGGCARGDRPAGALLGFVRLLAFHAAYVGT